MLKSWVIKVGGNELEDARWVADFAASVSRLKDQAVVIVHGGGREVSALQHTLGSEPEWRDGLRVTSDRAMPAVSMVLSGLVNKRLVAALLSAGVDALGISGEDGALIEAAPLLGGALGRTGEVVRVRHSLLEGLLDLGLTPVVSPVSRGRDGRALNVNADDSAAAIARALSAAVLLFVSNVPGVLGDGDSLPEIEAGEVEPLISSGVVTGGMAPKLRAAARAAAAGATIRIGNLAMFADPLAGTRVAARALSELHS